MTRHLLIVLPTCVLALIIFIFSVYSASAIEYEFVLSASPSPQTHETNDDLPNLPLVLPDNPMWIVKVAQDRVRILAHIDPVKQAEELIFISNERLAVAQEMFVVGESGVGMATLAKAEKYLYNASLLESKLRAEGVETSLLLQALVQASSTHTRVIDQILTISPEDATPIIVQTADTPKRILEATTTLLRAMGQEIISLSI